MDSGYSRPASPTEPTTRIRHRRRPSAYETSTILIDTTTLTPEVTRRPTIEQNMAFAALQQSLDNTLGGNDT
jgi:hypothetical protein